MFTYLHAPTLSAQGTCYLAPWFQCSQLCLLLATSLVGTSLLATPMWLEGQEICPGVQVISDPIDPNTVPSSYSLDTPQGSGILVSQNLTSFSETPILCETFYTTVVIQSTKDKVSLPFKSNQTPENEQVFHDAANHTADQLANTWLYFAESVTINDLVSPPSRNIVMILVFILGRLVLVRILCMACLLGLPPILALHHGSCMLKPPQWHGLGWIHPYCPPFYQNLIWTILRPYPPLKQYIWTHIQMNILTNL